MFIRKHTRRVNSRVNNMLLSGGGAETLQDRGARSAAASATLHPYYSAGAQARWREYTRWYMTAWEARKIIDIPVDDALRKPVETRGLAPEDEKRLADACEALDLAGVVRRALIQERLLGGSVILPVLLRPEGEKLADPLRVESIQAGDLKAFNVVDLSRVSPAAKNGDPFSEHYDRMNSLVIQGREAHASRLCVLSGAALFHPASAAVLEGRMSSHNGFGESRLTPLYDLLNRVTGAQQGAYHLVNMASCLLLSVDNLRSVAAADSPALAKLREITEQLSIYRGAVIDAKGAKVEQHAAAFGSVPELVMTFAQLLSAASDIPASRFLGQAPGGLSVTGEGDRKNYYDMVAAYQRLTLAPLQRRLFGFAGASLWGWEAWARKAARLELFHPGLESMSEKEEADIAAIYGTLVKGVFDSGVVSAESAIAELTERNIFLTRMEAAEFLERPEETNVFP